jgi:hypothetical protein
MNFETSLLNSLAKYINKKSLSIDEKKYTLQLLQSMDKSIFRNYDINQVISVLTTIIGNKIKKRINSMHKREYMDVAANKTVNAAANIVDLTADTQPSTNAIINSVVASGNVDSTDPSVPINANSVTITTFLGIDNLKELKLYVNPESMYEHYYVALDSDYRNTTNENPAAIQQFTWNYSPTQNVLPGFCNSIGTIHNIVGIRIYQPRIPYLVAMNTSGKRVSILVQEFSAQAFITEIGTRFHFLLRPEYITAGSSIELSTEDYNDGIFTFSKPFTEITSLTIVFGDPINPLIFTAPFDRFIIALEFTCLKDLEADY